MWCTFITALGRRQAGRSLELEACNVTIVRPCLKKKEKKKGHLFLMSLYAPYVKVSLEDKEGIGSSEVRVTHSCELLDVGAGELNLCLPEE